MKVSAAILPAAVVAASLALPGAAGLAQAEPSAADCLEASAASLRLDSLHRLRAERAELLICASLSCPPDIRNECIRRVDEVNAAIPSIMFEVKDAAGNDLSAVRVSMDGQTLTDRLEGIALPIDPGAHLFTFEAARQALVRKHFVIREGEKRRRESIVLVSATARPVDDPPAPSGLEASPAATEAPAKAPRHRAGRTLPLIAAGVAVAGLGLGTAFGLQAMSRRDDAHTACPGLLCANQAGVDMWQDARRSGTLSTIAFAVGGAGLLGAMALWFATGPEPPPATTTEVAVAPGVVTIRGRW